MTSSVNTDFKLELIQTTQAFEQLRPHWDRLLDSSAVRTPFMRWDWVSQWWTLFQTDYKLAIGAVWNSQGQLIALAPFVIGPGTSAARKNLRHLSFIGGLGEVISEGVDLICQPGFESHLPALLANTFQSIRNDWDTAFFGFMDPTSPFYSILQKALHIHASQVTATNQQLSPIIRLHGQDWKSYLLQRSGSFRKKYKGLLRDATARYHVSLHTASTTSEAADAIAILMQLHAERWSLQQSLFLQPRTQTFHQSIAKIWCPANRAALMVLAFDGRPVAANYAFVDGHTLWDYQGGWSVADIGHSPAKLIMAENIRWAMDHGITDYDMLPGDIAYKSKWTGQHRTVVDLVADNPASLRVKIFQSIRTIKNTLASLVPNES